MKQVNFRRIVQEIQDATGWSDEELAAKIKTHRSTISRLRTGAALMPTYATGDALVKLHDERPLLKSKGVRK